jgi:hypothetical protein
VAQYKATITALAKSLSEKMGPSDIERAREVQDDLTTKNDDLGGRCNELEPLTTTRLQKERSADTDVTRPGNRKLKAAVREWKWQMLNAECEWSQRFGNAMEQNHQLRRRLKELEAEGAGGGSSSVAARDREVPELQSRNGELTKQRRRAARNIT